MRSLAEMMGESDFEPENPNPRPNVVSLPITRPSRDYEIATDVAKGEDDRLVAVARLMTPCTDCVDGWQIVPAVALRDASGRSKLYRVGVGEAATHRMAVRCDCSATRDRIDAFNRAKLDGAYREARIGQGFDWHRPAVAGMKKRLAGYFATWQPGCRGLVLEGPPGTGKTHIAGALVRHVTLGLGRSARWVWWPGILDAAYRQVGERKGGTVQALVGPLMEPDLLVIDEIAVNPSVFATGVAERLIGQRCEQGKTVVVTHNLVRAGVESLDAAIGDRATSRLLGAADVIRLAGDDYRRRGAA